ncbi:MAG: hypothetical protein PUB98_08770 [Clostridiales bacterium]|nr:hypothetical protein [Clostridiales bacterium]
MEQDSFYGHFRVFSADRIEKVRYNDFEKIGSMLKRVAEAGVEGS